MSTKQTYFQEDWLKNIQYSSWLKRKGDKKVAHCAKYQKTIELSNMGEKGKIAHERQKTRWKCRNNPTFFRPTKEANDKNEISAVYMPNSSQIQTNKTKETQQVTLSFISK